MGAVRLSARRATEPEKRLLLLFTCHLCSLVSLSLFFPGRPSGLTNDLTAAEPTWSVHTGQEHLHPSVPLLISLVPPSLSQAKKQLTESEWERKLNEVAVNKE